MPQRKQERVMKAAGDRPTTVRVPDRVWKARHLRPGAKLFWCFLRIANRRGRATFTYRELREAIGVCQNSVRTFIRELKAARLLRVTPESLRSVTLTAMDPGGSAIILPTDILFDVTLPEQAKWLWGVIQRRGRVYDYGWLERETKYCRESLIKYLRLLRQYGWINAVTKRVKRRLCFAPGVFNPPEARRRQELAEARQGLSDARRTPGYSAGQHLAYLKIQFLLPDCRVLEESKLPGLVNRETRGRMHVDLVIPERGLAIEFQGAQHYRVTELYPSPEALAEQQKRDDLKKELCPKLGWTLLSIGPEDLSFKRLEELLAPFGPVNSDPTGRWHMHDFLNRVAKNYREAVRRAEEAARQMAAPYPQSG